MADYPPYFSLAGYRAILERAQGAGYRTSTFRDFEPPGEEPVLLLRHDLDHSIRSAAIIADLEADLGVLSTYFVQVTCDFYNLLSAESRQLIRAMAEQGHEIGLHYDAGRYLGADREKRLRLDVALLEDIAGTPIVSASQHIPIDSGRVDVRSVVEHEAYEPRFTKAPMTYISDSLMAWRQKTPHDLLDERTSFQLLTHPMKWSRTFSSMREALQHALEEEVRSMQQRNAEVEARYRWLLDNRERLDAQFKAREHVPGNDLGPNVK